MNEERSMQHLVRRLCRVGTAMILLCVVAAMAFGSVPSGKVGAPREVYVPGELIIKLKPGVAPSLLSGGRVTGAPVVDQQLARFGVQRVHQLLQGMKHAPNGGERIFRVAIDPALDPAQVATELRASPYLEYADPVYVHQVEEIPNDPRFGDQVYLRTVKAPQAWDVVKGDSTVVIAIVDNGVDYEHPDLAANLWTNWREKRGLPGVDDDGNGYIDDVHGYDLAERDNNPANCPRDTEGYYDHGTLLAGVACAVTNNGVGIAGTSWGCRYLPVKTSYDSSPRSVSFGYQGILYAARNGARIINCSWGRYGSPLDSEQDIITTAAAMGAIVLAAAGNTVTDEPHYPSAYRNVLSVTWLTDSDQRVAVYQEGEWVGSSYGATVDVAAPGFNIYSTVPRVGGSYGRAQGSSLATPVVAGICGLVATQHPEWSPSRVMQQVVFTADNIDRSNPGFEGQLGSGRANAFRAVSEAAPAPVPPKVRPDTLTVTEAGGDGDGAFEHNELIHITGKFRNFSITVASNASLVLSSVDTSLDFPTSQVFVGHVGADADFVLTTPLVARVLPTAPGHTTTLHLSIAYDGGTALVDSLRLVIGTPPVLVVDDTKDAEGSPVNPANPTEFYTYLIDSLGVPYGVWDHLALGTPSASFLLQFPIVIWVCEWSFPYLTTTDMAALSSYLDGGGSLFITGQDLAYSLADPTSPWYGAQGVDFLARYLHLQYRADDNDDHSVVGVTGDPIGHGLAFSIYQPSRAIDEQFPEVVEPVEGGLPVFTYSNKQVGAVRYQGAYRTVFFGFGLEAIDATMTTVATSVSPIRKEVLARTLRWLNPIEHTPLPDTEDPGHSRPVGIVLQRPLSDLLAVELLWRKVTEPVYHVESMRATSPRRYEGEIPATGDTATVEYYFRAKTPYYTLKLPFEAPATVYRYSVGSDRTPPSVTHEPLRRLFNAADTAWVVAVLRDNLGIDTSQAWVYYGTNTLTYKAPLRPTVVSDLWRAALLPVATYGDTVRYAIVVRDLSTAGNEAVSDTFAMVIGYEDFESGLADWEVAQGSWGLDSFYARSGQLCINQSPGQTYPTSYDGSIAMAFGADLSGTSGAALYFWTKYFIETNKDFGYVEVSTDGGRSWSQLGAALTGVRATWTEEYRSLRSFTGPGFSDVRIRFRFLSDANQGPLFRGWFIDDVRIVTGPTVQVDEPAVTTAPAQEYALLQNHPNPFNRSTEIRFLLPQPGHVRVRVFNPLGKLVATLVDNELPVGEHRVRWSATQADGTALPSGLYLYRLEAPRHQESRKMVLLQ